ncbi:hypothetical protein BFJ66_g17712 [Fusarium oxysporum f. sp. cepae]|uniref:Extracellular membrane protein CFEM domain-containing protein n=1 Tax=Fusarium oxysporum f. sp. cepae TaxID=396571 RepID=A0A3L6MQ49_FUSOX|nr:hypothetical protein BFJ65_g18125 [Fusarium oxysporum f. sp. cepae]RKK21125.1 hypothetical protein BFJ66_g17712 [Fusarium oxysporum f. sp. cepae]
MLSKNVLATLSLALASGVMANPPHGQPACCSNSKGICATVLCTTTVGPLYVCTIDNSKKILGSCIKVL